MELQNKRTRNVSRILLENDHVRTKSRGRSVRLRGRKPSTKATKALQYPKQKIKNLLKPIFSSRISNLDKLYPISTDKSSEHISAQFNQKTNEKENDDNMSSSSSSSNFNDAALDSEQDHFNNMIALSTENSALHRRYEREHADRLLKSFESGHDTTSKSDYDRPFWPNNAVSSDYGKDISPWIDLIMPGYSQPYCTRINIISRDEKHCSDGCPLSYSFGVRFICSN
ncbi:hypothetical protein BEWA_011210 [Theileria equi strain WA]|uniref:Uncharacterized protein n=1 Tax=Theileria equi strain WA TaxID=1537102 RepID=L0B2I3_THEEQ|nr:hypothetical protein BEWA_011210 [Theileria equi strain WA]AFZ81703.1 hypothetical protein BEWA_011210 [Theileria equi strain WA]|eukprot:XP_004831369.1 hypothetical protein BEWA_011210 [Theileria equi strain WA]